MLPYRTRTSRSTAAPTPEISHAACRNRYSLTNVNVGTKMDAAELWATVVDRLVTVVPRNVPAAISVATVPSALLERQSRKRARPSWSPPDVTPITERLEYHVSPENVPDEGP